MLKAIARQVSLIENKSRSIRDEPGSTAYYLDHLATEEDTTILVREDDFLAAQQELVGSIRCVGCRYMML